MVQGVEDLRTSVQTAIAIESDTGFTGIGVMSCQSGEPLMGDFWLLGSALSDAAYIISY